MRKRTRESSLDAMQVEIRNQTEDIPRFARELAPLAHRRNVDPSKMIFTGSGDSFGAALFAQGISDHQALAADPYELYLSPETIREKALFLISVSGRTKSNIKLARRVRSIARKRIAITANPSSPLARECDDTIELHYASQGILTSGTVSFTTSLLAVASLIGRLPRSLDLRDVQKNAAQWAEIAARGRYRDFFFVGSKAGYAIAAYGAFKIHEVLGLNAEYQYPEQIGHSQLFSIRRESDRIICISLDADPSTRRLFRALSANGFQARLVHSVSKNPVLAALDATLHVQHLALALARRLGFRECAFLVDHARLSLSSQLIY